MPGGYRTGPEGAGSMTGRKAGYCNSNATEGRQSPDTGWFGAGFRRCGGFHGFSRGLNRGRKFRGTIPTEQEVLQSQRDLLRRELTAIDQQIAAIDDKDTN